MSRRVTAALGAAALLAVALPALPALAAAGSAVTMDGADTEVLPGAENIFDIALRNSESNTLLSSGRTINRIRILLPSEIGIRTTATPVVAAGWESTRTTVNGLERYDLKPVGSNTGLAPGATLDLDVPGLVGQPLKADRSGALQLAVSSNAGDTYQTATGSLATTVRTLKVTTVAVVDRPGQVVADGDGTAGQTIDTQVTVQNLAATAQDVAPKLASTGGSNPDTVPDVTAAPVPANGTRTFTVPVTLGNVTSDTTRTFTATATSTQGSSATTDRFRAQRDYTVQVAPAFTFNAATFQPKNVNGKQSYDFKVDATKTGTPSLSLPSGALTFKNRANGALSDPIALQQAVTFVKGTNQTQTFTFTSTRLDAPRLIDGRYDAGFTFAGRDGNGFTLPEAALTKTLADVLDLDNVGPTVTAAITLPNDRDGDRTTAARNYVPADNNEILVQGSSNDTSSTLTEVVLECANGVQISPAVAPTTAVSGASLNYTARFRATDFGTCGSFVAKAAFDDLAKNTGSVITDLRVNVDNTVPTLRSKDGILGAVGRFDGVDPAKPSVMVNIGDQAGVIGGCDARSYTVDGQLLVHAVFVLEDGGFRECTTGVTRPRSNAKPANNARYLQLNSNISRGSALPEPVVTYDPTRSGLVPDRVKDAAGNFALDATQDTVNRLVPAAPVIVAATRANRAETASDDGTAYYTRFSGTDLKITVTGGLAGDTLELVKNGTPLPRTSTVDGGGEIAVPVDADETKVQDFAVRFVSKAGVLGDLRAFKVRYDITLPKAVGTAKTSSTTASVTFTESLLGGNQAQNWNAFETVQDEAGNNVRAFRGVNSVSGAGNTRTLSADFTSAPYGGAMYEFIDGTQYSDLAGNKLAKTTLVNAS